MPLPIVEVVHHVVPERQRERAKPVFVRDLEKASRARLHGADVVDQDVERSVLVCGCDELDRAGSGREVDLDLVHTACRDQRAELGAFVTGSGNDMGALGDERTGDSKSNSSTRAGHESVLTVEDYFWA